MQKCSLVKDVPWETPDTSNNYALIKNAFNSNLATSTKLIFGGKKTNAVKNPMLDNFVDISPDAVLSVPLRRRRPQKLKFCGCCSISENSRRSVGTSQEVPLEPDFTCSEVVFDLEDVDGVFFASFPSKEVLDSCTVDYCVEREEMPTVQASDYQVRLHLLESKLLEDLNFFRHRQVIHPSLQEVGLKLGSVDQERSIDLKYLGVQLPLNLSKDYDFGASSTSSQDTGLSFISRTGKTNDFRKIKGWQGKFGHASGQEDTGLSFISRTGKTDDFRKIKGWQGKFHQAFGQEDIISKSSLKNQSAFYSDKLDEYLENEGKLMETSLEFSTTATNSTVLCQLPSKNPSYIEKNQAPLHKMPPSSYTFKPLSLLSIFRKRKTKRKRKRATSRGRPPKLSNKPAVPSFVLSRDKYAFPEDEVIDLQSSSQVGDEKHLLLMSELGENVQRQRTQQQTQQSMWSLPKEKLMDMVLEYCMSRNRKSPTHISEGQAKPSLASLFDSQGYDTMLPEKPYGTAFWNSGDTQAATILPPGPISMSQNFGLFPNVYPAGMTLAQMAGSESDFAYYSSQQLNIPTSLVPFQPGNLALHQLQRQQIAQHTLLPAASNLVSVNHAEGLGFIKSEEGTLSHLQKVVVVKSEVPEVPVSDTMPEEKELMVNTTCSFDELTDMMKVWLPKRHLYCMHMI